MTKPILEQLSGRAADRQNAAAQAEAVKREKAIADYWQLVLACADGGEPMTDTKLKAAEKLLTSLSLTIADLEADVLRVNVLEHVRNNCSHAMTKAAVDAASAEAATAEKALVKAKVDAEQLVADATEVEREARHSLFASRNVHTEAFAERADAVQTARELESRGFPVDDYGPLVEVETIPVRRYQVTADKGAFVNNQLYQRGEVIDYASWDPLPGDSVRLLEEGEEPELMPPKQIYLPPGAKVSFVEDNQTLMTPGPGETLVRPPFKDAGEEYRERLAALEDEDTVPEYAPAAGEEMLDNSTYRDDDGTGTVHDSPHKPEPRVAHGAEDTLTLRNSHPGKIDITEPYVDEDFVSDDS